MSMPDHSRRAANRAPLATASSLVESPRPDAAVCSSHRVLSHSFALRGERSAVGKERPRTLACVSTLVNRGVR